MHMKTSNKVQQRFSERFSEKTLQKSSDSEGGGVCCSTKHEPLNLCVGGVVVGRYLDFQLSCLLTPRKKVQRFRNGLKIKRRLVNEPFLNPPGYPFIILNPSRGVEAYQSDVPRGEDRRQKEVTL